MQKPHEHINHSCSCTTHQAMHGCSIYCVEKQGMWPLVKVLGAQDQQLLWVLDVDCPGSSADMLVCHASDVSRDCTVAGFHQVL